MALWRRRSPSGSGSLGAIRPGKGYPPTTSPTPESHDFRAPPRWINDDSTATAASVRHLRKSERMRLRSRSRRRLPRARSALRVRSEARPSRPPGTRNPSPRQLARASSRRDALRKHATYNDSVRPLANRENGLRLPNLSHTGRLRLFGSLGSQAGCRGFEPLRPLLQSLSPPKHLGASPSAVEAADSVR